MKTANNMIILGIETSCDETALALIETRGKDEYRVISSLVHSQAELHSAYGGVFPNLAKREHSKNLIPLLRKLLDGSDLYADNKNISNEEYGGTIASLTNLLADKNADLLNSIKNPHSDFLKKIPRIDVIAVTEGPGLEPALWVGINFAIILSTLWHIPVRAVNHMEGHIVGSLLHSDKPYGTWQTLKELALPSIALLISGGHTEIVKIEKSGTRYNYTIIGQTKDDAVGEAFDKVARLLGLPYPGGPHISKLAYEAKEKNIISTIKLPRPMINSSDCDFSFSGLKTAVLYATKKLTDKDGQLAYGAKAGLAREFEEAVVETLSKKLIKAIEETSAESIIIGGGVSANRALREKLGEVAAEFSIPLFLPDQHVSGDNALMIALVAAIENSHNVNSAPSSHIVVSDSPQADGTKSLV